MSVSTGPFLFCEGKQDGRDQIFLNRVVGSRQIVVRPLGGKYGLHDQVEGYLNRVRQGNAGLRVTYLVVRDRDLDHPPEGEPRLLPQNPGKKDETIFMLWRACIENYLVDAALIYAYWDYRHHGPTNRPQPPLPQGDIEGQIVAAAREIAGYQAVRWGLASIRPTGQHYWPRLQSSWRKDGELPAELDFGMCLKQAQDYFEKSYTQPTAGMTWETVRAAAHHYQARFSEEDFYARRDYLTWFHGKDLIRAVFRRLNVSQVGWEQYVDWGVQQFDYIPHADLNALSRHCDRLVE